jgi:hypothetical protein
MTISKPLPCLFHSVSQKKSVKIISLPVSVPGVFKTGTVRMTEETLSVKMALKMA